MLVALNLGPEPAALTLPGGASCAQVLLSTHLDRKGEAVGSELRLRGDEGVVVALDR